MNSTRTGRREFGRRPSAGSGIPRSWLPLRTLGGLPLGGSLRSRYASWRYRSGIVAECYRCRRCPLSPRERHGRAPGQPLSRVDHSRGNVYRTSHIESQTRRVCILASAVSGRDDSHGLIWSLVDNSDRPFKWAARLDGAHGAQGLDGAGEGLAWAMMRSVRAGSVIIHHFGPLNVRALLFARLYEIGDTVTIFEI